VVDSVLKDHHLAYLEISEVLRHVAPVAVLEVDAGFEIVFEDHRHAALAEASETCHHAVLALVLDNHAIPVVVLMDHSHVDRVKALECNMKNFKLHRNVTLGAILEDDAVFGEGNVIYQRKIVIRKANQQKKQSLKFLIKLTK
jgi:hypothetical protein